MPLPAVTYDRMKQVLDKAGLNYIEDDDGRLLFVFDEFFGIVEISETSVTMTAYLSGRIYGDDQMSEAIHLASNYSLNALVPKVSIGGTGTEDNPGLMMLETFFPTGAGMTDQQLQIFFGSTMGAYTSVLQAVSQDMPQLITPQEEN